MTAFFENFTLRTDKPPPNETANVSKHKLTASNNSSITVIILYYFFLKISKPKNVIAAQTAISEKPKLNT